MVLVLVVVLAVLVIVLAVVVAGRVAIKFEALVLVLVLLGRLLLVGAGERGMVSVAYFVVVGVAVFFGVGGVDAGLAGAGRVRVGGGSHTSCLTTTFLR